MWAPSAGADSSGAGATLPGAMHAAVETQAFVAGTGAVSTYVDPGPAYGYAVLDYTRMGSDKAEASMTSRGAVGNPGTLAAAVLWAAPSGTFPNCGDSTGCYLSPTGVHEAAGTPGYAEAIYPAFPGSPDRRHVKKCIVNKDANGANPTSGSLQDACAADAIPAYASADSDMDSGVPSAHGFTRALGGGSAGFTVAGSEANADVRPDKSGNLVSTGYSHV